MEALQKSIHECILDRADFFRIDTNRKLDSGSRMALGQFMTPASVAGFMASLFGNARDDVVLLDPGAGVGSLTAAFVEEMSGRAIRPRRIRADAYEIEPLMLEYLASVLLACPRVCAGGGIQFAAQAIKDDFIERGVTLVCESGDLFGSECPEYTHCIMNPPYKKIRSDSDYRVWLRQIGVETSNLYTAFLAIAIKLLATAGELVAIVPRSFCNGVYFKPFRALLLREMALKRLHVFDARDQAFKDDDVLQENIIFHAVKGAKQERIVITSSSDPSSECMTRREVDFERVVKPGDPDRFIHIAVNDFDQMVVDCIGTFTRSLTDLGLDVCTGPVVDFRLRADLRQQPGKGACPVIYPGHFSSNYVKWPKLGGKKPNAIVESEKSRRWLMANGWYVVTRRFSAKEERRRIVAAIHDPANVPGDKVGFENHLNVFHRSNGGLDPTVAKGLALYLNSTLVDLYFRQFSGHTQVNAADLRMIHYPDLDTLARLGKKVDRAFPNQEEVDGLLDAEIDTMTKKEKKSNPLKVQGRRRTVRP
ncbi:MAG: Eco57I restriction-modification methylase domain-containing protein [Gammaproteobacteria bacterium]